jgi:hypothetical protein
MVELVLKGNWADIACDTPLNSVRQLYDWFGRSFAAECAFPLFECNFACCVWPRFDISILPFGFRRTTR